MAKRVMADIVSSPLVLMPFMVGSMAFASLFALGLKGSAAVGAVLIGLVGTLASAGTFLTKFILGRDDRIRKLVEASRSKAKRDKRKALDHFHHRLTMDGDERTETAMQDLRSLRQAFRQLDKIAPDLNRAMIEDIQQRSEELFQQCMSSLEKTLQLWKTADSLASEMARKPILEQREKLVGEAVQTVENAPTVFVRTPHGFQAHPVSLGQRDENRVEIRDGLQAGQQIATAGSFILKSELGKGSAEHVH